jgi:CheY-like chemotaxis protein
MDKETVSHIFEPFFTTKGVGEGTGLGLASVYGIVKSHGGHIDCYSEIGQGTIFKIYLPAIEQPAAYAAEAFDIRPPQGGTETILLVDDEDSIRDFASQVLHRFGYTILTASSGEEALEIYLQKPRKIDLVIMDIGMPGMGGHQCLKEIIRYDPSARILVASGYSINDQVKKTLEAGAAGYVGKPYDVPVLLNKVRAVLDEVG